MQINLIANNNNNNNLIKQSTASSPGERAGEQKNEREMGMRERGQRVKRVMQQVCG